MKTNVELKGLLMLCAVMGLFILHILYFQHTEMGTIILIALTALFLFVIYWMSDNSNDKQFERVMKKVGGDNLLYIVDGSAAVGIDSLNIYYKLKRNKYDKILERNNKVEISVSCALPICTSTKEAFNNIKNYLNASLKEDIVKCAIFAYRHYSFDLDIELQPTKFSIPVLKQIQQSLVSVLINKYQLNTIKHYFKINKGNGWTFYWEFIGSNAVRCVSYNAEKGLCNDNEDVSFNLSDIDKETVITEQEFQSIYEYVENTEQ